ncbi:hypothetical protein A3F37_01890 [Candidatus Saccharibacteria bacterium RIFCSPHIGHO2_12_FULL_41_12]|nr:MAG: hypothetical protein A3F37_01890 [Candidatus Saccharibacteria bacterium RIFCSPHIGHO2_12_FULL_41_12]
MKRTGPIELMPHLVTPIAGEFYRARRLHAIDRSGLDKDAKKFAWLHAGMTQHMERGPETIDATKYIHHARAFIRHYGPEFSEWFCKQTENTNNSTRPFIVTTPEKVAPPESILPCLRVGGLAVVTAVFVEEYEKFPASVLYHNPSREVCESPVDEFNNQAMLLGQDRPPTDFVICRNY